MDFAFEFIIKNGGIDTEDDYPYTVGGEGRVEERKVGGRPGSGYRGRLASTCHGELEARPQYTVGNLLHTAPWIYACIPTKQCLVLILPSLPPALQAEEGQCQENKLGRHVVTIDDYQVRLSTALLATALLLQACAAGEGQLAPWSGTRWCAEPAPCMPPPRHPPARTCLPMTRKRWRRRWRTSPCRWPSRPTRWGAAEVLVVGQGSCKPRRQDGVHAAAEWCGQQAFARPCGASFHQAHQRQSPLPCPPHPALPAARLPAVRGRRVRRRVRHRARPRRAGGRVS